MTIRPNLFSLGNYIHVQGGYAYKSKDFVNTGIPVLKIKNVKDRIIDITTTDYVNEEVAAETIGYYLQPGDILISMTGSGIHAPDSMVGRVARYNGPKNRYLFNQRVGRLVITKPDFLDNRYLFLVLAQPQYQWELVSIATGSANQVNISGKQIEGLIIPVPTLKEQQSIVTTLGAIDDKIEVNRQMNKTLEGIARTLFRSWFVDFDPVRAKMEGRLPFGMDAETAALFPDGFEDSRLGEIPKGWKAGNLQNIADIIMGQSPPSESYNDNGNGLPFYQGIRDFQFRFPSKRIYCDNPGRIAEKDDVLLSVRAPVGSLNIAIERCILGRGLAALRPKSKKNSFLYYLLKENQSAWDVFNANGTVFGSVSKTDIQKFSIKIPSFQIEQYFNDIIEAIDCRIESNENEIAILCDLRDTLLPKLLSGEIRVKQAEKEVGAVL